MDRTQAEEKQERDGWEWLGKPPDWPQMEAPAEPPAWLDEEEDGASQAKLSTNPLPSAGAGAHEGAQRLKGPEGGAAAGQPVVANAAAEPAQVAGADRSAVQPQRSADAVPARPKPAAAAEDGAVRPAVMAAALAENAPPLPHEAQFDPALGQGAGEWLDRYCEYGYDCSPMTPRLFHESAGLWLASVAVARRLSVARGSETVYPNLWVLWLAPTTVWHKTTALNGASRIAAVVFPHLMAAHESTPESLLCDLGGREPAHFGELDDRAKERWRQERNFAAQRGLFLDEFAGFMSAANRDYNAGLIDTYMHLYDCYAEHQRSTRSMGRVVVRNAYLSLLGATTPGSLRSELSQDRLWDKGWWGRFALLTPDRSKPEFVEDILPTKPRHEASVTEDLRRLYKALPAVTWPAAPEPRTVEITPEARAVWQPYNKALSYTLLETPELDRRLNGSYGRLPVHALRVALLLAALDWRGRGEGPVVALPHVIRGMTIAEGWRASLHRVVDTDDENDFATMRGQIIRQLARAGQEGRSVRELFLAMRKKNPGHIEDTIYQMERMGEVAKVKPPDAAHRGRPTVRYALAEM